MNKIENNKKEQIEELYKRTKEKEINQNNLSIMQKQIEDMKGEIENIQDDKMRLRKELESLSSEFNFYQDELKMKNSIIKDFKMKNMELRNKIT